MPRSQQVRAQDGTIVTVNNIPDDATDEQVIERARAIYDAQQSSPAGVFAETATKGVLNRLLSLPRSLGQLASRNPAGLARGLGFFESVPVPTVQGIAARLGSVGTERSSEEILAEIQAKESARREAHPFAAGAGDVATDILSLLGLRAPVSTPLKAAERVLMTSKLAPKVMNPGVKKLVAKSLDLPAFRTLARGAGRAGEAGVEAMVLDILNGDDPLETAMYAAGVQAVESGLLQSAKGIFSGGVARAGIKFGFSAMAIASILQILKDVTPGGRDSIIDSTEFGFEKVTLSLLAGMAAAGLGGGRARGGFVSNQLPKTADAFAAVPRIGVIHFLEKWVDADPAQQQQLEEAINQLAQSPGDLDEATLRRLNQALEDGRLAEELVDLSSTPPVRGIIQRP